MTAEEPQKTGREWTVGAAATHEVYQALLASYALGRHGTPHQLKGVVHEYAHVLKHNVNPAAVLEKGWAYLNPNSRAVDLDVLYTRAAGVQLKDTTSPSGARTTALRAPTYAGAVLGTPETVAAVSKHNVQIESTGISSAHNSGVAARAGSPNCLSWAAVGANVKNGAAVGAAFGVARALYRAYERYEKGEGSWQKLLEEALRDCLVGAASGGAVALAGTFAGAVLPPGNAALIGGLAVALIVALLLSKVTDEQWGAFFGGLTAIFALDNALTHSPVQMP